MNGNTPNEPGPSYEMYSREVAEIRRPFEEMQKQEAQIQREQIRKRIRYGKAANRAKREHR